MAVALIRQQTASDEGYMAKSWVETLRGLLPHPPGARTGFRNDKLEHEFRLHWYGEAASKIRQGTARVAYPDSDGVEADNATILGWCWPGEFVYVRANPDWRRKGVAKLLEPGINSGLIERGKRALHDMLARHWTGAKFLKHDRRANG